ncbi:MAG: carboxypeptidase-like regulatory domain-containing protein, partial [Marinilabiliales bacterium]|nr:carboxypeptidase-like regulatory domain-containing protein [Marinilabiliales bacterium]
MQKFLLMMAFSLFLGSALKSQTVISGVVTDSLKAPIPFAAVFLSKTTIGTTTNANGAYTLTIPQPGEYEVAASCVGYKGFLKPFSADGKPHTLDIRLSVSSVQIEEVTVQAKSNHRIKNVTAMADLLLGQGQNAENSKILNEDQLFLTRDPQSGVVKGHSLRPLEVENRSLGYMLFYELTDFFFDPSMKLLRFSGNYYFKEMTGSPKEKKKWALHRLQTYYGSRMHFLRALFADSLKQQQYNLTNCEIENVVGKSGIVSQKGHSIVENRIRLDRSERQMILNSDKPLWIRYFDNKPELSQELIGFEPHLVESLLQLTARVTVYRDGRVDNPYAMTWSGEMAEERLSDLLPFDFMPPVTGHSEEGTLAERSAEAIFFDHLKEKGCRDQLFLHVDRNLYLPGDTLFFQAYVRDRKTGQFGSESRVLYLLLFDAKGEKADSARFRINNFTSSGYLTFPEHAVPGVYHLAAFTSAMQQEDPSAAFQMDLRVRESEELPQQVVCRFNKDLYHPSDTLELSVEVTDRAGNAITGQRVNCGLLFGKGRMKSDEANTNNRGESFFRWILPDTLHLQPQIKVFLKQSSGKFLSARELTVPWEVGFAGLAFLPEGGTFIEGIRQKVAFNATDLRGEPVPVTGLLKNSAGLILDTIRSGAYGPGSFVCLAKEGLTVELLSGGGQQRIWPLPQPTEKGFTLAVTKSDSVTLALDVEEGRYRGEQLTMAGFINGTPFFSREITLSRKVHLLLRTEQLPSGIAEF